MTYRELKRYMIMLVIFVGVTLAMIVLLGNLDLKPYRFLACAPAIFLSGLYQASSARKEAAEKRETIAARDRVSEKPT